MAEEKPFRTDTTPGALNRDPAYAFETADSYLAAYLMIRGLVFLAFTDAGPRPVFHFEVKEAIRGTFELEVETFESGHCPMLNPRVFAMIHSALRRFERPGVSVARSTAGDQITVSVQVDGQAVAESIVEKIGGTDAHGR